MLSEGDAALVGGSEGQELKETAGVLRLQACYNLARARLHDGVEVSAHILDYFLQVVHLGRLLFNI